MVVRSIAIKTNYACIKIKKWFIFRVEVPLEHLANPVQNVKIENDIDVPLPTDQVRLNNKTHFNKYVKTS